jgi:hypothetical protein
MQFVRLPEQHKDRSCPISVASACCPPAPDSLSPSPAVEDQAAGIRILASAPDRYEQPACTAEPVVVMSAADWHPKGQVRKTDLESSLQIDALPLRV